MDIEVDPGTRGDSVGGAVAGTLAGVAGGAGATFALVSVAPLVVAVAAGALLAAALGAGSMSWAGSSHRRRLRDVLAEVEGILDDLENGEMLEPPPPSWRQWVKRHFHGVAKDFLTIRNE